MLATALMRRVLCHASFSSNLCATSSALEDRRPFCYAKLLVDDVPLFFCDSDACKLH